MALGAIREDEKRKRENEKNDKVERMRELRSEEKKERGGFCREKREKSYGECEEAR